MTRRDLLIALGRLGWTQAELARRIRSYPATIARYDEVPGAVEAYINLALDVKELKDLVGRIL